MKAEKDFTVYTKNGILKEPPQGGFVIALGTFDGVHSAHKRLFEEAMKLKSKINARGVGAWCFRDLPAAFLRAESIPKLMSLEEKVEAMLSFGLDFVAVGSFEDFRALDAESFVTSLLIEKLGCVGAVCGFNHRFGYMGKGNAALLTSVLGEDNVVTVEEISYGGETVSSSAIRRHISSGDMERATIMLGRPFSLKAPVIGGKRLGRKLNFPTANQNFKSGSVTPLHGIYATRCKIDGIPYMGVSNVGIRPSIVDGSDDHTVNCETYIIDFSGDLYGKELTVEFCKLLRTEKKFDSIEALRRQISLDVEQAKEYFESGEMGEGRRQRAVGSRQ